MSAIQKKLWLAGIVLVAAISYLGYTGTKSGWVYFIDVDRYQADKEFHGQRVRLHGKVAETGFSTDKLDAQFTLLGKGTGLNVTYHGVIPEMFQVGRDVVVEGKLDPSGTFRADLLMTKCASKYEPSSPHQTAKENP